MTNYFHDTRMQIGDLEKRKDSVIQGWFECDLKGDYLLCYMIIRKLWRLAFSQRDKQKTNCASDLSLYCLLRENKEKSCFNSSVCILAVAMPHWDNLYFRHSFMPLTQDLIIIGFWSNLRSTYGHFLRSKNSHLDFFRWRNVKYRTTW